MSFFLLLSFFTGLPWDGVDFYSFLISFFRLLSRVPKNIFLGGEVSSHIFYIFYMISCKYTRGFNLDISNLSFSHILIYFVCCQFLIGAAEPISTFTCSYPRFTSSSFTYLSSTLSTFTSNFDYLYFYLVYLYFALSTFTSTLSNFTLTLSTFTLTVSTST